MDEHKAVTFLPDRLNREPVIFRGLTHSELFWLAQFGALVWFPVALLVCWWTGAAIFGLALGLVLTLATLVIGGTYLQRHKRGKPEGWFTRQLKIRLQDHGIVQYGLHRYSGAWDIQRRQKRAGR